VATKSTLKRYTQRQLTKIFSEQSKRPVADLKIIWQNSTNDNSLRLSIIGFELLVTELKIKAYYFALDKPLTNKNLIQLERFFPGLYYYWTRTNKFIVFDEQDAMWLELQDNDLAGYLDNLETNT
jgi:hypothetical protein